LKKFLLYFLILTNFVFLISCRKKEISYTISIYDNEQLINNFFVNKDDFFDKNLVEDLKMSEGFKFFSVSKNGEEFNYNTKINSNLSLYAVYEAKLPPGVTKEKFKVSLFDKNNRELDFLEIEKDEILTRRRIEEKLSTNNEIEKILISLSGDEYLFNKKIDKDLSLWIIFKENENDDIPLPPPSSYYKDTEGLTGNNLKNKLQSIINMKALNYNDANTYLTKSDLLWGSTNMLYLIYDSRQTANKWDGGNRWNKEHVWPDSKLGSAGKGEAHNLRAATVKTNRERGNLKFVDGSGSYGVKAGGYYPGDDHKGDVARIIMYMVVRYPHLNFGNAIGEKNTFLKWHKEDPVDNFEKNRNNVLYQYQKNRNPFIDHPEFADLIWNSTNLSANDNYNIINYILLILNNTFLYYENKKEQNSFIQ